MYHIIFVCNVIRKNYTSTYRIINSKINNNNKYLNSNINTS